MIQLYNVTKEYKITDITVKALEDINLSFPTCGLVFVLGKSGSGKSTILNLISGLDKPTVGKIIVNGLTISEMTSSEMDKFRSNRVGFVFQDYSLINSISVHDNINLALAFSDIKDKNTFIENALNKVGIFGFQNRFPYQMSGGQQQRVAIARAIIHNPQLICADEPTGNLDEETGSQIFSILKSLSTSRLVVIATHDEDAAIKYGDRIIRLKDGAVQNDNYQAKKTIISDYVNDLQISRKNQKISNKIITSMAISNIRTRTFRSFISVFILFLSMVLLTFSLSAIQYQTEEGIYLTLENNNSEYLHFYQTEVDRYGDIVKNYRLINRSLVQNAYELDTYTSVFSRVYYMPGLGGPNKYFNEVFSTVSNTQELLDFGINLLDGYNELDDYSVVLSNLSVDYMSYNTKLYENTGVVSSYVYYVVIENVETYFDLETILYEDLIGKEIRVYMGTVAEFGLEYYASFWISGIYEIDYHQYFDEYFNLKEDLTEDEFFNWTTLWSRVYKTYITKDYRNRDAYIPCYCYKTISSYKDLIIFDDFLASGYSIQLLKNRNVTGYNNLINIGKNDFYNYFEGENPFILLENSIASSNFELQSGYVYINLETYNGLFGTEYVSSDFVEDGIVKMYPEFDSAALTVVINDSDLETTVFENEYQIGGLIISDYSPDTNTANLYVSDTDFSDFIEVYYSSYNVISVYIGDNFESLIDLITEFSKYDMLPDFDYSNSFYAMETGVRQSQTLMTVISIVMIVLSFLMIGNLISLSITSKRKEIGILMALGYSKQSIKMIFLFESTFIGLVSMLLSVAFSAVSSDIMNSLLSGSVSMYIRFFAFHWSSIGFVFILCICLPILATIIPAHSLSKLTPVECIRKTE